MWAARAPPLGRSGGVHVERDAAGEIWIGGETVTCANVFTDSRERAQESLLRFRGVRQDRQLGLEDAEPPVEQGVDLADAADAVQQPVARGGLARPVPLGCSHWIRR
jgi:hypothetical protein